MNKGREGAIRSIAIAAMCLAFSSPALAWGDRGHSIVGEIAQRHLSPGAAEKVQGLLGAGVSMASVASWADDYKFTAEGLHTKPWHFVDVEVGDAGYAPADCPDSGYLVSALTEQSAILSDPTKPEEDRRLALLLLIHLVGDSTQLFHCTERQGDGGGNKVKAVFERVGPDGKPRTRPDTNLHAVWDETLVDAHAWNWGGYAADLDKTVVPGLPPPVVEGDFVKAWIDECHAAGERLYQLLPQGGSDALTLGADYQKTVQPILDQQLATGGLRLAALLNVALK